MKKYILILIKVILSFGLIYWLLSRADLTQIWQTIRQAKIEWLVLAFMQFFVGYFIVGLRWQSLLAALKVPAKLWKLIQSFSIAMFFNNFLPSTIGGDAYRIYDSYRLGAGKARAIAVVFVDRVIGLTALLLLAFVASFLAQHIASKIPYLNLFFLVAISGISVLAWVIFGNGAKVLLDLSDKENSLLKLFNRIFLKLYSGFHLFQGRSDVMLKAIGLSLLLQINVVIHCLLITWALGIDIPLSAMFIIIPLAYLAMAMPISINGIGLRETIFVTLFGFYGVASEPALAFAFVSFGMILAQGVIGGILFMIRKNQESSHQHA